MLHTCASTERNSKITNKKKQNLLKIGLNRKMLHPRKLQQILQYNAIVVQEGKIQTLLGCLV